MKQAYRPINPADNLIGGNNKGIIAQLNSWLKILIAYIVAIIPVLFFKKSHQSSDIVRWHSTYQQ